jgi:hypothetical protein
VVETGVAYGVNSAFILAALEVNGNGQLHSIDLPPLAEEADKFVGMLIPESLRPRWHLYRGASRRILPSLLSKFPVVDIFIHDSLHTYRNIQFELEQVAPHLRRPHGIVLVDDVQGNRAFLEWSANKSLGFSAAVKEVEKDSLFGLSITA